MSLQEEVRRKDFGDIPPYMTREEVKAGIDTLVEEIALMAEGGIWSRLIKVALGAVFKGVETTEQFKKRAVLPVVNLLALVTAGGISSRFEEDEEGNKLMPPKGEPYVIISNHVAIEDPEYISAILVRNGYGFLHYAAGSNLYNSPLTEAFCRLDRFFMIPRDNSARGNIRSLIRYMGHLVETGEGIWIAQSRGRAKDGNYLTDPKIIELLRLANVPFHSIYPASISYRINPNDSQIAREMYLRQFGEYTKTDKEDMDAIIRSMLGRKGLSLCRPAITVRFGTPLEDGMDAEVGADHINKEIARTFQLYDTHLAAYFAFYEESPREILERPSIDYSALRASPLLYKRVIKVSPEDRAFLLRQYGNPVRNRMLLVGDIEC